MTYQIKGERMDFKDIKHNGPVIVNHVNSHLDESFVFYISLLNAQPEIRE